MNSPIDIRRLPHIVLALSVCAIPFFVFIPDSVLAQPTWTTPRPIDTTVTADQEGPLIAVSQSGTIAIVCREGRTGHLVLYTSDDHGTSFTRHQLASPPTPEYELYYPSGIAYDSADNLWVLWEWDLLKNGWPLAFYLSLSKSTDGGESFSEILRHNRGLTIQAAKLHVDEEDNIHLLRDSIATEPRVVYTKLISGDPATRIDTFLPQPENPSGSVREDDVDFWVDRKGSIVHYTVEVQRFNGSDWEAQVEYSMSLDGGLTFSPLLKIDTVVPPSQLDPHVIVTSSGVLLITYETADFVLQEYRLKAAVSEDNGSTFGDPFEFGTYQSGQVNRLAGDTLATYAFYSTPDIVYGMVYEQYSDPRNPPTEVATFDSLLGDFSVGPQGEKYAVMRATPFASIKPPYLFFSSKDIPTGVAEDIGEQGDNGLTLRLSPNPYNSSTHFFITVPRTADVSVDVFDLLGRRVYQKVLRVSGPTTQRFALEEGSSLATGMYLIRVASEGQVRTAKLLKIR